jgi:hypothetical protein
MKKFTNLSTLRGIMRCQPIMEHPLGTTFGQGDSNMIGSEMARKISQ